MAVPLLAAALVLSACGVSDDGAEPVEPVESVVDDVDVTTSSTDSSPTTSVSEADSSPATSLSEVDPDRSPPTTETAGLESTAEATPVPAELTCWRVEDFGEEAAERWRVINDGVMGGLSEGFTEFSGGVASFSGTINTNGGGFSMIRTSVFRNDEQLGDALEGAEFIRLRVRSANGRRYEFTVQDMATNTAVMHFVDIPVSSEGAWQEPVIALADLEARVFGTDRPNLPAFNLDEISTFGIILADGFDGPFSLEVDRIDACARP